MKLLSTMHYNLRNLHVNKTVTTCILIAIACVYFFIYQNLPLLLYTGAPHDDTWYLRQAFNLRQNQWFGVYDQMALIKGPGYPFFLYLQSFTPFSLQQFTALVKIISALVLHMAVRRIFKSQWLAIAVFTFFLFSPYHEARVLRDQFNAILSVLIVALCCLSLVTYAESNRLRFSILIGLLLGLFRLTREDAVWIYPVILLYVLVLLFYCHRRSQMWQLFRFLFFFIASLQLPSLSYGIANYVHYGLYVDRAELRMPGFRHAMSALQSIREGGPRKYVEITNKNIEAARRVSSTFNKVYTQGEGAFESWRVNQSCNLRPNDCENNILGYFMWAFRDAMAVSGFYRDAATAEATYQSIGDEIRVGCKSQSIRCSSSTLSLFPAYEEFSIYSLVNFSIKAFNILLNAGNISGDARSSFSPYADSSLFNHYMRLLKVGNYYHMDTPERHLVSYTVRGWYYKKNEKWFTVDMDCVHTDGALSIIQTRRNASPDLAVGNPRAKMQRFELTYFAHPNKSSLCFNGAFKVDVEKWTNLKQYDINGTLTIESVHKSPLTSSEQPHLEFMSRFQKYRGHIANLYNSASKFLFPLGLCSFAITLVISLYRRRLTLQMSIISILWLAFFARMGLLIVVAEFWLDSYALNLVYLYPALEIWPVAVILSLYTAHSVIWGPCKKTVRSNV
jgi:hypothetical protein